MKILFSQLATAIVVVSLLSCNANDTKNAPVDKNGTTKDTLHPITAETANAYSPTDISPMDMSYYPVDYPKLKMEDAGIPLPIMRVIYSRPHLQERKLFPDILKYGERWRMGANEATEIQFYRDVIIEGKQIKAGRYILYCIPEQDKWSIVCNTNIDSWGLKQDTTKDIQRFEIPVTHHNPALEHLTIVFEKANSGANLIIGWDEELAKLPINF